MDVRVEKIDINEVKLEIKLPSDVFKKAIDKAYNKNVSKFQIPGFRKGKAPKAIIEKMYGEGVFYEDAVNYIFEETYPVAVKENDIKPVDRPEIDVIEIGKDKDFIYTAKVTVKPEVELGDYKAVEVKYNEYPVSDEDVDKEITSMRDKNARIIAKDGEIQNGDIAVIDFEGFIDDIAFEGGEGKDYSLEIGSGSFINGFEEQLIGKKSGEDVDVNVTFPEDYNAKELAGKNALFKVKINEVRYKELLPLDDEFAKDVSEFDTLDELKKSEKDKLIERNEKRAKSEFEDEVIKKVVENAKVEIPEAMINNEVDYMMNELKYRLQYQGLTLEQYLGYMGLTEDKIKDEYKEGAKSRVKTQLVLEKIAKVEGLTANEEEIKKEIEKMAESYNQDVEKLKETLGENTIEAIKENIVSNKTIDYLINEAKKIK